MGVARTRTMSQLDVTNPWKGVGTTLLLTKEWTTFSCGSSGNKGRSTSATRGGGRERERERERDGERVREVVGIFLINAHHHLRTMYICIVSTVNLMDKPFVGKHIANYM